MWRNVAALFALTILTILGVVSVSSHLDTTQAAEAQHSVTVKGFGSAVAPVTRAQLQFWFASSDVETPTMEALQPVIDALVASGIDAAAIEPGHLPTLAYELDPRSPGQPWGQLLVTVAPLSGQRLHDVGQTVEEASAETQDLRVVHVGAIFGPDDCVALRNLAIQDAVEDARERSGAIVAIFDGKAAEVTAIREEFPSYGPSGPTLCAMPLPLAWTGSYPPLDSHLPVEVLLLPLLDVTFAVE